MMRTLLTIFITLFMLNSFGAKSLPAHEHGSVKLDLAVDNKTLLVMLNSPSESFLGFEYKAKSKKEKRLLEEVKTDWNKNLLNFIGTKELKSCRITKSSWKQKFTSSSHSNIVAESYIDCPNKLSGKKITLKLMSKYQRIKKIHIQLIRDNGSAESKTFKKNTNIALKL